MSLTQSQPVSAPHRGAGSPASGQGTWALGWPEVRGTLSGTKHFIGLVHTHVGVHNSLGYFYEMAKEVNYDPIHFFPNFSKTVTIFHRSTSIKLFPVSNNAGLDKALMGFPANFPSLGLPHPVAGAMCVIQCSLWYSPTTLLRATVGLPSPPRLNWQFG